MEEESREVVWMPAFASAVLTLILTSILPLLGSLVAIAAVVVLAIRLPRREWTVLSWVCLGALIGSAIFWILVAAHAVL